MNPYVVALAFILPMWLVAGGEKVVFECTLPDGASVKVTRTEKEQKIDPPKDPLPPGTIFFAEDLVATFSLSLKQPGEAAGRIIHSLQHEEFKDALVVGGGFNIYDVQSANRKLYILYARDLNLMVDIVDLSGNAPKPETVDLGWVGINFRVTIRRLQLLLTQDGFMCMIERKALTPRHDLEIILAEKNEGQWSKKAWVNKDESWKLRAEPQPKQE